MLTSVFSYNLYWQENNLAYAEIQTINMFTGDYCDPNGLEEPIKIKVGVLINNIAKIDLKAGEFEADYWYVIESEDINFIEDGLPPVTFTNGLIKQMTSQYIEEHYYEVRMIGVFFANMDLHQFPFEKFPLTIEIEPDTPCYIDSIVFEEYIDASGVDSRAYVPGWEITKASFSSMPHYYEGYDLTYARLVAQFDLERPMTSSFMNLLFPVLMITALSILVLWIPENFTPRIYLSAPLLLSLVYLHTGAMKDLPPLGYLTVFDKIMFINFTLFANTILSLGIQMRLHVKKEHTKIKKVNKIQRYLIGPIILILTILLWNI